jgi:hypothetical protein
MDSNHQPLPYQGSALPVELSNQCTILKQDLPNIIYPIKSYYPIILVYYPIILVCCGHRIRTCICGLMRPGCCHYTKPQYVMTDGLEPSTSIL